MEELTLLRATEVPHAPTLLLRVLAFSMSAAGSLSTDYVGYIFDFATILEKS